MIQVLSVNVLNCKICFNVPESLLFNPSYMQLYRLYIYCILL